MTKSARTRLRRTLRVAFWAGLVIFLFVAWAMMIRMPGQSYSQPVPPLADEEKLLREELMAHVAKLGGEIGERNLFHFSRLEAAAEYIEEQLSGWNLRRDRYQVQTKACYNIEAERPGKSPEIVLIGAHYDSVPGSPGANDNGSGVAALLALAHRLKDQPNEKTLRLVAFVNEEPGFFQTPVMGSHVYAGRCRERSERIAAMISLETIGYFSDEPGSQRYPALGLGLIYPRIGNFIGFVGNLKSRSLLRDVLGEFRRHARIRSEGAALPEFIPGVGWSDQWSFWQHGYPGIMVTDTAPFRYPYYHSAQDTPDKLDYDSMTRVVVGMDAVIRLLVSESP